MANNSETRDLYNILNDSSNFFKHYLPPIEYIDRSKPPNQVFGIFHVLYYFLIFDLMVTYTYRFNHHSYCLG